MKSLSKLHVALVAGLFLAGAGVVSAYAGMWSGLPPATSSPSALNSTTLPLTGNETGAFDTNLSGGRNPQTETISVDQIKTYVFGNGGSAGATPATQVSVTGTSGSTTAASGTCDASLCIVTTPALTTAISTFYTVTLSNSNILTTSVVLAALANGTNTSTGSALRTIDQPWAGATVITIKNEGGISFNGTVRLRLVVIN